MQTNTSVFFDAIVETGGSPPFRKENHADGLAEIVELETCGTDAGHDGGIGDRPDGDLEFAGAKDQVSVGGGAERVAYHEEGDILFGSSAEDLVAVGLDHLAVGEGYGAAIVGFLLFLIGS